MITFRTALILCWKYYKASNFKVVVTFAVCVTVKECDATMVQGPYSRTSVTDSSPGTVIMTIKVEAPIYTQQKKNKKLVSPPLLLLHLHITMMMSPVHREDM